MFNPVLGEGSGIPSAASPDRTTAPRARSPVEGVRVSLDEDGRLASERWDEAEKALCRALADKRSEHLLKEATPPLRDRSTARPLQLSAESRARSTGSIGVKSAARSEGRYGGALPHAVRDSDNEDYDLERSHDRTARIAAARSAAFEERAKRMRRRADDSRLETVSRERRKLRVKIVGVLQEVKRRQELLHTQEKARAAREALLQAQSRTSLMPIGEATLSAVGLCGPWPTKGSSPTDEANPLAASSPRRSAILESLTLEELDMLRRNTLFFFEGATVTGLCNATLEAEAAEQAAEVRLSLEPLVDFFTPAREDKNMPIGAYMQKLRKELEDGSANAASLLARAYTSKNNGSIESLQAPADFDPNVRMPCQGRLPAVREDHASPTLKKVREVYDRRDDADARFMAGLQEAMVRREAQNAFKASEQQRERQLEIFKQKELHKVRMLETEERKTMLDLEQQERVELLEVVKARRLRQAEAKAEDFVEERRDRATMSLERWRHGMERSQRYLRDEQRWMIARSETRWGNYVARLWSLGLERHDTQQSHGQKNYMLKVRIQAAHSAQLAAKEKEDSESLKQVLEEKQQKAAERRERLKTSQYNFRERSFGAQARTTGKKFTESAMAVTQ